MIVVSSNKRKQCTYSHSHTILLLLSLQERRVKRYYGCSDAAGAVCETNFTVRVGPRSEAAAATKSYIFAIINII